MEMPTLEHNQIVFHVCAWCNYLITEDGEREEDQILLTPDLSISHGICIICAESM